MDTAEVETQDLGVFCGVRSGELADSRLLKDSFKRARAGAAPIANRDPHSARTTSAAQSPAAVPRLVHPSDFDALFEAGLHRDIDASVLP
jgi:hypothetical protein